MQTKKQTDIEVLINKWEKEYREMANKAEEVKDKSWESNRKITYKALQLKYCIKQLKHLKQHQQQLTMF